MEFHARAVEFYARAVELYACTVEFHARAVEFYARAVELYARTVEFHGRSVEFYGRAVTAWAALGPVCGDTGSLEAEIRTESQENAVGCGIMSCMTDLRPCRESTGREYEERLRRVLDHIDANLDAELTPASLARVAAFSPFHFQRIFRAMLGRTLAEHVRNRRLDRAARLLRDTSTPIVQIARRAGYETQESFTRAFTRRFGLTPAAFRREGGPPNWRDDPAVVHFSRGCILSQSDHSEESQAMMEVSIKDVPRMKVAFLAPEGPRPDSPEKLGLRAGLAIVKLLSKLLLRGGDRFYKCVHVHRSDPRALDDKDWIDFGFVLDEDIDIKDESVRTGWIGGGEHAVAIYDGALTGRDEALDWLYGQWLPSRGLEPADGPAFEELFGVAGFDLTNVESAAKLDSVFERDEDDIARELPEVCRFAIHIPVERTRIAITSATRCSPM